MAAPSWNRLVEGIVLVRLEKNDALIDEVFAPDDVDSIDGRGRVNSYRSRGLLQVATDNRILIVSHRHHRDSVYHRAVQLLRGLSRPSLAADPDFSEQVRGLPPGRDGTCYINGESGPSGRIDLLSLALRRVAVGLTFQGNRVDFAIRAKRSGTRNAEPGSAVALTRMKQLPQTTLGAWCTELDLPAALDSLVTGRLARRSPAFARFVNEALDVARLRTQLVADLTPAAVIAWDQHLGDGPEVPQLALLIESNDAPRAVRTLARAAQSMVDWFDLRNRSNTRGGLRLLRSQYLGTTIHELAVPAEPAAQAGARAHAAIRPAFGAVAGALVIAVSADQIRNIIDARLGLTPKLSNLEEVAAISNEPQGPTVLAVAQPALAAQVVESWLAEPEGLMAELLGEVFSTPVDAARTVDPASRVGIRLATNSDHGTVRVAAVTPGSRAFGALQAGDEIIGLDGELLSFDLPDDDLRRRLARLTPSTGSVFRVRRDGAVREIRVPADARHAGGQSPDPAQALKHLQLVFRLVDFGSVRVTETPPDTLAAQLTLRFNRSEQ